MNKVPDFRASSQMFFGNNRGNDFSSTFQNVWFKPDEMMYHDTTIGSLDK